MFVALGIPSIVGKLVDSMIPLDGLALPVGVFMALAVAACLGARLSTDWFARRAINGSGFDKRMWLLACALSTGLAWALLSGTTALLVWALYIADRSGDTFATTLLTAFVAAFLVTAITETLGFSSQAWGQRIADSLDSALRTSTAKEEFNHQRDLIIDGGPQERRNAIRKVFDRVHVSREKTKSLDPLSDSASKPAVSEATPSCSMEQNARMELEDETGCVAASVPPNPAAPADGDRR